MRPLCSSIFDMASSNAVRVNDNVSSEAPGQARSAPMGPPRVGPDAEASAGVVHGTSRGAGAAYNIGASAEVHQMPMGNEKGDASIQPASAVSGGTQALVKSFNRRLLGNVYLGNDSIPGTILLSVPLTSDYDTSNNKNSYQQYSIESLVIEFVSTAPFGTSSGAILLGSSPDPSNVLGSNAAENLVTMFALTGSTLLTAKNNTRFELTPASDTANSFKWVKKAGVPRLESFGNAYVVVQQPSAVGTVAQWTVAIEATYVYRQHTKITTSLPAQSIADHTYVDFNNAGFAVQDGTTQVMALFPLPANAPVGATLTMISRGLFLRIKYKTSLGNESWITVYPTTLVVHQVVDGRVGATPIQLSDLGFESVESVVIAGDSSEVQWIISATTPAGITNYVPIEMLDSLDVSNQFSAFSLKG